MDPFSLQVLKALTAALEQITPANGYQHDLAGRAYRGRLILTPEDGLPAVAINEPPEVPESVNEPAASARRSTRHPLLIQGFVVDDRQNPTDPGYRLLSDVQKRLMEERTRGDGFDILGFGSRVTALEIGRGVVRPPEAAVSDTAFFWLPVTIGYAEDLLNPFV